MELEGKIKRSFKGEVVVCQVVVREGRGKGVIFVTAATTAAAAVAAAAATAVPKLLLQT